VHNEAVSIDEMQVLRDLRYFGRFNSFGLHFENRIV